MASVGGIFLTIAYILAIIFIILLIFALIGSIAYPAVITIAILAVIFGLAGWLISRAPAST